MHSRRLAAAAAVVILVFLTALLIIHHWAQGRGSYFTPIHIESCGNGVCEPNEGETCALCPEDCGCGDGQICNEWGICVAAGDGNRLELSPDRAKILEDYVTKLAEDLNRDVNVLGPFAMKTPWGTYMVAYITIAGWNGVDTQYGTKYYVMMDPKGRVKVYVRT